MEYYIDKVDSHILKKFTYSGIKDSSNKEQTNLKIILNDSISKQTLVDTFLNQLEDLAEKKPDLTLAITKDTYRNLDMIVSEGHSIFPFTQTQISTVISEDGGKLLYRGHPIGTLLSEDAIRVASLLILNQHDEKSVQMINHKLQSCSNLPPDVVDYIISEPIESVAGPMSVLRTSISKLGTFERPIHIKGYNLKDPIQRWTLANELIGRGLDISAKIPTIISYLKNTWDLKRMEKGLTKDEILKRLVEPDPSLDYVSNFLNMFYLKNVNGNFKDYLRVYLIAHMSHGMNASSHTMMQLASTEATLYAAMTSAEGALSGPKHGGASDEVLVQLRYIRENIIRGAKTETEIREKVKKYITGLFNTNKIVYGMGHSEYKKGDPRATLLEEYVKKLSEANKEEVMYIIADQVKQTSHEVKGKYPNVDFWASQFLHHMNVPEGFALMFFAAARSFGWVSNYIEQLFRVEKLIRPTEVWTGPVYADGLQNTLKSTQTL